MTGIPLDASFDEVHDLFKKYGLIEEDIHTGLPKIKLYADDDGNFKGDARISMFKVLPFIPPNPPYTSIIVYFRYQSVDLAIQMCDKTDFRTGTAGSMHVEEADFSSYKNAPQQKEVPTETIKKKRSKHDRAMAIKKTQEMNEKLSDWPDDDIGVVAPPPNPTKYNKMVVLKHMFTLEELDVSYTQSYPGHTLTCLLGGPRSYH